MCIQKNEYAGRTHLSIRNIDCDEEKFGTKRKRSTWYLVQQSQFPKQTKKDEITAI